LLTNQQRAFENQNLVTQETMEEIAETEAKEEANKRRQSGQSEKSSQEVEEDFDYENLVS